MITVFNESRENEVVVAQHPTYLCLQCGGMLYIPTPVHLHEAATSISTEMFSAEMFSAVNSSMLCRYLKRKKLNVSIRICFLMGK